MSEISYDQDTYINKIVYFIIETHQPIKLFGKSDWQQVSKLLKCLGTSPEIRKCSAID